MEILNQPKAGMMGDMLSTILTANELHKFDTFSVLVAYAKTSGVDRLAASIRQFKESGGQTRMVVGVNRNQKNTSAQALQHLLPLCNKLWVYNIAGMSSTYHPKVYIFEKLGEKATVFVGSSNLTGGGLYMNREVNSFANYNLTEITQAAKFLTVSKMFEEYSEPSKFCKILTPEYLQELFDNGYLSDEKAETPAEKEEPSEDGHEQPNTQKKRELFGYNSIHAPPKPKFDLDVPSIEFRRGNAGQGRSDGAQPVRELPSLTKWWKIAPGRQGDVWPDYWYPNAENGVGMVSVGWGEIGDLSKFQGALHRNDLSGLRESVIEEARKRKWPTDRGNLVWKSPQALTYATKTLASFAGWGSDSLKNKHGVIAYSNGSVYAIGEITGGYEYEKGEVGRDTPPHYNHNHIRRVRWFKFMEEPPEAGQRIIASLGKNNTLMPISEMAVIRAAWNLPQWRA